MSARPSEWRAAYLGVAVPSPEPVRSAEAVASPGAVEEPSIATAPPPGATWDAASVPPADAVGAALALAEATARDGAQRALEFAAANLEELQQLRLGVRAAICAEPDGSPLRHVMPWLWTHASTGRPLTEAGAGTGYELRLSRYAKPLC
jgi:hypothetical protein